MSTANIFWHVNKPLPFQRVGTRTNGLAVHAIQEKDSNIVAFLRRLQSFPRQLRHHRLMCQPFGKFPNALFQNNWKRRQVGDGDHCHKRLCDWNFQQRLELESLELHFAFDRLHSFNSPCRFVLTLVGTLSVTHVARDDIIHLQTTINQYAPNA